MTAYKLGQELGPVFIWAHNHRSGLRLNSGDQVLSLLLCVCSHHCYFFHFVFTCVSRPFSSMAPKKKPQSSKGKGSSSTGPKLQISAENENRLRRLLLNSGRSTQSPTPIPAEDALSKAQKAKKLRSIYEKLSCEGFSNNQIELALSALKVIY